MKSPKKVLSGVVAGVVVVAGAGWAVGTKLRSPADEAASRTPPKASLVTVPVKKQKLVSTVTVNGELAYGSPLPLFLGGVVGGTAVNQRVTRAPRKGRIKANKVLMEVNGRPVLVLQGKVPMHRTLSPGVSGADVKQLQRALHTKATGVFDAATASAVKRWYAKLGYRAQEPDLTARQTLEQLKQAVQAAQEGLSADSKALDNGKDVLPLKLKLDNAKQDLRSAEGALELAEDQETTPEDATRVQELERAVRSAEEELLAAEQALSASTDTDKSLLQLKVGNARQNLAAARQALASYSGQAAEAREKRLEELRKSVRAAQDAVVTAEQALRQAKQLSPLRLKVTNGKAKLASARDILAEYLKTYGTSVPPGELVFLPKLPSRLDSVSVKAGDLVTGKVGTVTSSSFAVEGSVEDKEATLLRKGAEAVIETANGKKFPATLTSVGASKSGSAPVVLTPSETKGMDKLVGSNVTVRVSIGATDGEVLTVPVAAIVTSADGKPRVQIEVAPDKTKSVEVRTGLTADGNVEVTGPIKEGDLVVIDNA
ncbi:peptidoglycan-binding protein [Nonomuraea sp. NPDC050556]|uniref:peptidoglycan-binding protein n=1 Tax=Nonomuraea sp. NPDC050556 TaxID=3364369 RepID=UPI0037A796C0